MALICNLEEAVSTHSSPLHHHHRCDVIFLHWSTWMHPCPYLLVWISIKICVSQSVGQIYLNKNLEGSWQLPVTLEGPVILWRCSAGCSEELFLFSVTINKETGFLNSLFWEQHLSHFSKTSHNLKNTFRVFGRKVTLRMRHQVHPPRPAGTKTTWINTHMIYSCSSSLTQLPVITCLMPVTYNCSSLWLSASESSYNPNVALCFFP